MMTQKALANKRHNKQLKRKNKKYTGPKYSALEQHMLWAPLLEKAGIINDSIKTPQISTEGSTSFV